MLRRHFRGAERCCLCEIVLYGEKKCWFWLIRHLFLLLRPFYNIFDKSVDEVRLDRHGLRAIVFSLDYCQPLHPFLLNLLPLDGLWTQAIAIRDSLLLE